MSRLIYGPVPSRRFGLSLGVDVVPFKTCTLDCVYCQLGRTSEHTLTRREFVPVAEVVAQVAQALASGPRPDVITFAGSGEPTLHAGLGEMARRLKAAHDIPLLLITNGTLLHLHDVAADAACFDFVAPSLDAGDEKTFRRLNRPAAGLALERVIEGLAEFVRRWPEKIRLEVFFAQGINDSPEAVDAIIEAVTRIAPPAVDLNTATRPTPGRRVRGVSEEFLRDVAARMPCPAQPIAAFAVTRETPTAAPDDASLAGRIMETLRRRPCTAADLAASLEAAPEAVAAALDDLSGQGHLTTQRRGGHLYFVART